jgi:signal transduction histidine kinase
MAERPTTRGEATGGPVGDAVAEPAPAFDADPFGAEDLRRASARMQQYARWASPPNLLFAALLVVMYPYTGSVLTLILAVLLLGNAACSLVAHGLAARSRPAAAVLWQVSSLWLIALLLGISFGISAFAPAAMCAILPIAAAVPYVSQRTLLRMAVISAAVVGACAVFVVVPPPLAGAAPEWAVRQLERIPNAIGVTILMAVCGLSLWHTRFTLGEALARVQLANRVLEESERSLEDEVRKRTAELERSQREVALARDEALAANQRKSAFLASMSHELRTPLNAIIGFSEVMEARLFGELSEKQHEYVRDIHDSGQHLLSLINDIIDLSKVETGRVELSPSRFDLPAAVGNAVTLMKERATRSGIRLVQKLDPTIGSITADERKLKQVLINLLSNAVKFTNEGGSVTLRVERSDPGIHVSVTDTGIGIAPEDQAIVFEEFRQASRDRPREEGTGLGLALARRLVELHGGRIWLESAVGAGSTFHFTLPQALGAVGGDGTGLP